MARAKALVVPNGNGSGFPTGIKTGINWAGADYDSNEGRKALATAITGYLREVQANHKSTRLGHLGNLPDRPDVDVNFYGPAQDLGIMSLFRPVDKTQSKNPTYQFANVDAGAITFVQKTPGKPVEVRNVTDAAAGSVSSVTWEGAIGLDDEAKRFDDYMVFEENVQAVPAKWWDKHATNLATLIAALGAGINETFATDLITTLNNACAQILEDAGDTYGLTDKPTYMLLYNHRKAPAIRQALMSNLLLPNDNNSGNQLEHNIIPVPTRKIATTYAYLCVPGYDMVDVMWDDLYSEYARDSKIGSDAHIWRTRRNAAVGNTSQIRRISYS